MTNFLQKRPWTGRIGALVGIMVMALSLRTAVSVVPPLLGELTGELGFTAGTTGLLAMMPPLLFAIFGLLTPVLIRRFGLEKALIAAVVLAVAGQLGRVATQEVWPFLGLTAVIMAGYGIGNVVLPPLVKKYFPDRVGLVTAGYVTLLAVGTAISPQLAVPIAGAANWRVSIGMWASVSFLVLLPWVTQFVRDRRIPLAPHDGATSLAQPAHLGAASAGGAGSVPRLRPWRSPVAWGLAIFLAGNSAQTYVYFTWLPPYLSGQGIDAATAGSALAYFAILGLPVSLLVPLWVPRMKNPIVAIGLFAVCWATGHLGLYLSPLDGTWLWVTFAGLGQGTFATALLMVNLRSRTTHGSSVLSGFSQGLGYAGAGLVPLVFGTIHDATGTWTASFAMLGLCLAVMMTGAVMINAKRYIEDSAQ
ncbi:MFS transporter, CP family, cyanate transporter [Arthrobacter alpinus]|uniref:MFS transporter, CP family, cyanate transporter n=1 Tax=Arthrobacter alpinus TaxID=656366 RepID=A0A1H5N916_9MICC|nr:MFS transporter [Arthrobacter alpinus]SEE98122.1 MFS transporter, CP family, cyanate transporter [Arthrobacter alpinus]